MPKWANFFWKKCVVKFDFCVVVNFSEIFTVYSKILRQESRGTKNWQDICFYFNIFQHICFYFANFPHFFLIFDQNLIVCHLYSFIIRKEGVYLKKRLDHTWENSVCRRLEERVCNDYFANEHLTSSSISAHLKVGKIQRAIGG